MGPQLFDIYQAVLLDISHSGVCNSLPLPVLERGRVYDTIGSYDPVVSSSTDFAAVALIKSISKKFIDEVPGESLTDAQREAAALEKFLAANEKSRETNSFLRVYLYNNFGGSSPIDAFVKGALGEARRFIHETLSYEGSDGYITNDVPLRDLLASLRCGPGSSNGAIGETFADKCVRGPMTMTTEGLYTFYKTALHITPREFNEDGSERFSKSSNTALRAEEVRFNAFGNSIVEGSKLAFAPKSWNVSRTIATEPSLNMMFQLGLHEQLCFFLSRIGFDLQSQQERNRLLARRGSETNEWFTMDLSSASDSVSIELIRFLFPEDWFRWFMLTRSPRISTPGGPVELHMLSSMGNGYTFAVETLVFLSLIVGVYTMLKLPITFPSKRRTGNLGVYGDDIIGLTEAFGPLSLLLENVGFSVNKDKSFDSGPFRESCGGDYFQGHDVRGVYSTTVSTPQERASFINRLALWGAKHSITFRLTSQVILTGDPLVIVPLYEADDAGIKLPYSIAQPLVSRPAGRSLASIVGCDHRTDVYQAYVPQPRRELIVDKEGNSRGFFVFNPDGLLLCALQGALQGRWLTLRSMKTAYKLTFKAAPGWDRTWSGSSPRGAELDWFLKYERYLYMMYAWLLAR